MNTMIKLWAVMFTAFVLTAGCAQLKEKSPFLCTAEECQVEGSSSVLDGKRTILVSYAVYKLLRNDPQGPVLAAEKVTRLAGWLHWAIEEGDVTGSVLNQAFEDVLARDDLNSEDKLLLALLAEELKVQLPDLEVTLSDEKRRVLNLFADVMLQTVKDFQNE